MNSVVVRYRCVDQAKKLDHITLHQIPEGEAWRMRWSYQLNPENLETVLAGVAFELNGLIFAARSNSDNDLDPPGIVVYEQAANGDLTATWYHPDLSGLLGEGRSVGGPFDDFVGTYRAEYASSEGSFPDLVKELSRQGEAYRFCWRTKTEILYEGIGVQKGKYLIAAWATPRAQLDVVVYSKNADSTSLEGEWTSISDLTGMKQHECWTVV